MNTSPSPLESLAAFAICFAAGALSALYLSRRRDSRLPWPMRSGDSE